MVRVTTGDLLDAIRKHGREAAKRPVGTGWYTVAQMAQKEGVRISAMRWRMQTAMQNGLTVERFVGSDFDPTGQLCKQTWFRVKR